MLHGTIQSSYLFITKQSKNVNKLDYSTWVLTLNSLFKFPHIYSDSICSIIVRLFKYSLKFNLFVKFSTLCWPKSRVTNTKTMKILEICVSTIPISILSVSCCDKCNSKNIWLILHFDLKEIFVIKHLSVSMMW